MLEKNPGSSLDTTNSFRDSHPAGFTLIGGVVPKSLAELLGARIVIMDPWMSFPSAYQVIVTGTVRRTAPRMIARALNPAWIAYGAYMAVVEVVCLGAGIVQSIRQGG